MVIAWFARHRRRGRIWMDKTSDRCWGGREPLPAGVAATQVGLGSRKQMYVAVPATSCRRLRMLLPPCRFAVSSLVCNLPACFRGAVVLSWHSSPSAERDACPAVFRRPRGQSARRGGWRNVSALCRLCHGSSSCARASLRRFFLEGIAGLCSCPYSG